MFHIRNNAETSVRNLLKDVVNRAGSNVLEAIDYLDDGTPVSKLGHSINRHIHTCSRSS